MSQVTAQVQKLAKEKYGIDVEGISDDGDVEVDSLLSGPTPTKKVRGKTLPNTNATNLMLETMERIEDRLMRVEGKVDDMYDIVREVKSDQKRSMNNEPTASVQSDGEDLPEFGPPAKRKAPEILGIPFIEVKTAYEGKIY